MERDKQPDEIPFSPWLKPKRSRLSVGKVHLSQPKKQHWRLLRLEFGAQAVMKSLCTFRARERCSAFIPRFVLMKQNWSDDGRKAVETTAGLIRHQPDEGYTSTSSSDTYLPCLHTRTHRNKPCLFEPTTRLPATFSQSWANRQATKRTRCFTDTHLPLPLSSAEYSVAALTLALVLISAEFGYFKDKVAWKSCVQQKSFFYVSGSPWAKTWNYHPELNVLNFESETRILLDK